MNTLTSKFLLKVAEDAPVVMDSKEEKKKRTGPSFPKFKKLVTHWCSKNKCEAGRIYCVWNKTKGKQNGSG